MQCIDRKIVILSILFMIYVIFIRKKVEGFVVNFTLSGRPTLISDKSLFYWMKSKGTYGLSEESTLSDMYKNKDKVQDALRTYKKEMIDIIKESKIKQI